MCLLPLRLPGACRQRRRRGWLRGWRRTLPLVVVVVVMRVLVRLMLQEGRLQ